MRAHQQRFSKRHGRPVQDREIKIREDAPRELREYVLATAYDKGFTPDPLRRLLCKVLRRLPDSSNWSEYPNVENENKELIGNCDWVYIYDIIEETYNTLLPKEGDLAKEFEDEINDFFRSNGIGWQLANGVIETRGPESFETSVHKAVELLAKTRRTTAMQEIHEALQDLSRRPSADITGAIQHAMAALECVARDVCGKPKLTLGEIMKQYKDIVPSPLDDSIIKAWGYASEMARHIREGRTPEREEAELIVGLVGNIITYLLKKIEKTG